MKKLVNSAIANRIYWATVTKEGVMGAQRVDVTDDAIIAVAGHISEMHKRSNGKNEGFHWPGRGRLIWIPESQGEDTHGTSK